LYHIFSSLVENHCCPLKLNDIITLTNWYESREKSPSDSLDNSVSVRAWGPVPSHAAATCLRSHCRRLRLPVVRGKEAVQKFFRSVFRKKLTYCFLIL
jgi:hypothetical protein